MKALSIVALVVAALSFFIPVFGVFTAMAASVVAVISFRWEATLSGITIGLNIVNTAFFSPSLLLSSMDVADEFGSEGAGELYYFYLGFHAVLLVIGIILSFTKKA